MKIIGLIYLAENKINGKKYIGQTIDLQKRKAKHFNKNDSYFSRALTKHGKENFIWTIIDKCEIPFINEKYDRTELNKKEIFYIDYYQTNIRSCDYDGYNGYNLTDGGDGCNGYRHSDKAKEKIAKSNKNRFVSKETRLKIGKKSKGRIPSNDAKLKMSKAKINTKLSSKTKQKISKSKIDKHAYNFFNSKLNIYELCNQYDLRIKYSLHAGALNEVIHNKRKSHKGWIIIKNK